MLQGQAGLEFQSTLPAGGATNPQGAEAQGNQFQSTLPVGGATVQPKHTAMTA